MSPLTKEDMEEAIMITMIVSTLGTDLPQSTSEPKKRKERRSLLQSSSQPAKVDPPQLPFSEGIRASMDFLPFQSKFYMIWEDCDSGNPIAKTYPVLEDSTLGFFKVLPITISTSGVESFLQAVLKIASYLDWSLKAANNEVTRSSLLGHLQRVDPECYAHLSPVLLIHNSCGSSGDVHELRPVPARCHPGQSSVVSSRIGTERTEETTGPV